MRPNFGSRWAPQETVEGWLCYPKNVPGPRPGILILSPPITSTHTPIQKQSRVESQRMYDIIVVGFTSWPSGAYRWLKTNSIIWDRLHMSCSYVQSAKPTGSQHSFHPGTKDFLSLQSPILRDAQNNSKWLPAYERRRKNVAKRSLFHFSQNLPMHEANLCWNAWCCGGYALR